MPAPMKLNLPHLSDEQVKLVPFDLQRHGPEFEHVASIPDTWAHLPCGPYASANEFVDDLFAQDPAMMMLSIIDITATGPPSHIQHSVDGGPLAGVICLDYTDANRRRAAIQNLVLLPSFRSRTFALHATRLLLDYGLTPAAKGGLGLGEMQWECSTVNDAALRVAIRLSLIEGRTVEAQTLISGGVAKGKMGGKVMARPGINGDVWQDVVVYTMSWKRWEMVKEQEQDDNEGEEAEFSESGDDDDDDDDEDQVDDDVARLDENEMDEGEDDDDYVPDKPAGRGSKVGRVREGVSGLKLV